MKKTIIVDDLDGKTEGAEEIHFALDGQEYRIDLAGKNAEKLRGVLKPYSEAGVRVKATPKPPTAGRQGNSNKSTNREVRAWAQREGIKVSARGRIADDVLDKYRAAQ